MKILSIIIDGLRGDELFSLYDCGQLTGGLKTILDSSVRYRNHYSTGCPTQTSFVSLQTGTFPLDFKGYDFGVHSRASAYLPNQLRKQSVKSYGLSSVPWYGSFFGYHLGCDIFIDCYDPNMLICGILNNIYNNKNFEHKDDYEYYIKKYKEYLLNFLKIYMHNMHYFEDKLKIDRHSIANYLADLKKMQSTFEEWKIFKTGKSSHIKRNKIETAINILSQKFKIPLKIYKNPGVLNTSEMFEIFYLMHKQIDTPKAHTTIHLMDLHELRTAKHRISIGIDFVSERSLNQKLYKKSLLRIDRILAPEVQKLKKLGYHLILLGDHGSSYGFPSNDQVDRDNFSSNMYDCTNTAICLPSAGPGGEDVHHITSHIDYSQLVLKMFKEGTPYVKLPYRQFALMETLGPGPGLLERKPIYCAVRSKEGTVFCSEYINIADNFTLDELCKEQVPFKNGSNNQTFLEKNELKVAIKLAQERISTIRRK